MRFAVLVAAALVAGCAAKPTIVAVRPPPPADAVPAPTPINAGLSPAGALWHLRAGLNVAALACRGDALAAGYNAWLRREAGRLKAAETAYAAEFEAGGAAWRRRYDDEMTRLYNFWSQSRGRERLCMAAGAALADPAIADDPAARLAALDRAFAPPWLHVDPAVFGARQVQVATR